MSDFINRMKQNLPLGETGDELLKECEQLEGAIEEIKKETKKLREGGWYDSGKFKMLKPKMARIIIDINGIAEKILEDK